MNFAILTPNLSDVIAVCAVIATLGVVFLARRSETLKLQSALRTSAYVDFIRGVAGLAILQRDKLRDEEGFRELRQFTMLVADAKARIAIYGDPEVVRAMASFVEKGAVLDSPERCREFATICQSMRNDGKPRMGDVSDAAMNVLLFK